MSVVFFYHRTESDVYHFLFMYDIVNKDKNSVSQDTNVMHKVKYFMTKKMLHVSCVWC